ncbi:hypothetical protein DDE18_12465 [Nocardioides gansuensis]|uniref:N-acetyltransferase domain-containing protein n=1 Tax=Nocardioides gansuensis TaxID=2138300 RepID=A0A2T8F9E1_9ACTN|nr:GNAT family N-acetyltransferase [Nocardioides gansuensis]PVG82303.1 hypothetical protein DDE18_12465 [Nocardioides gansuensis]
MTPEDDAYVREHFVPAGSDSLALIEAGLLPQASYVLSDGTPMVPPDHLEPIAHAGGVERVHAWWLTWWHDHERAAAEEALDAWLAGRFVCLRTPGPGQVRALLRWEAQARAAADALRADLRDHLARGSLGEAVAGLEGLLLPMTAYDEHRFGAPTVTSWVAELRREHLTPRPPELPIRTRRLVLRTATLADVDDMWGYYGDPAVTEHLLSDTFTRGEVEGMVRDRLIGPGPHIFRVVIEREGRVVGDVMLLLEEPGWDKAEIGWVVSPAVAGRGIATEAAAELLRVAFEHYGVHRVRAEMDARNSRSAALAERLGMTREGEFRQDFWSKGEWTSTPHYAILAEEWRARQG